jgi:murein DD-endopeptidase MepM/ murein hydrolase activator NlpD
MSMRQGAPNPPTSKLPFTKPFDSVATWPEGIMKSYFAVIIIAGSAIITSCGGNGNSIPDVSESNSEFVNGIWSRSWADRGETAASAAGQLTVGSTSITFPDNYLKIDETIEILDSTRDEQVELEFSNSKELFHPDGILHSSVVVRVTGEPTGLSIVDVLISDASAPSDSQTLSVLRFGLNISEQDDIESLRGIDSTYDPRTRKLKFSIDSSDFGPPDELGRREAVFVIFILPAEAETIENTMQLEMKMATPQQLDREPLPPTITQVSGVSALSIVNRDICPPVTAEPLIFPTERGIITSPFGRRNLGSGFHHALDFRGAKGEPVRSMKAGSVINVGYQYKLTYNRTGEPQKDRNGTIIRRGWGCTAQIKHEDGSIAIYAHLNCSEPNDEDLINLAKNKTHWSNIPIDLSIKVGDLVNAGDQIAEIGNTGTLNRDSLRPGDDHLHVEFFNYRARRIIVDNNGIKSIRYNHDFSSCIPGRYFAKFNFSTDKATANILVGGPVGAAVLANTADGRSFHCRSAHDDEARLIDWTLVEAEPPINDFPGLYICQRTRVDQRYMFKQLDQVAEPDELYDYKFATEVEFVRRDVTTLLDIDAIYPGDTFDLTESDAIPSAEYFMAKNSKCRNFRAYGSSDEDC